MNIWQEWRGPRHAWTLRTKVAAYAVAGVLVLAWVSLVDHLRG